MDEPFGGDEARSPAPATLDQYAAGWYPDPLGRHELRYHNGSAWTGDVSTQGQRFVDPLSAAVHQVMSTSSGRNGHAVVGLVLGIVALSTAWMPILFVIGAGCAVAAVIVGVLALKRSRTGAGRRSMAIAAVVLGGVSIPVAALGALFTYVALSVLSPAAHRTDVTTCRAEAGRASVTGTITNLSDETANFLVFVRFERSGTSSTLGEVMVQVDDVPAGSTVPFTAGVSTRATDVACDVSRVFGGLPVG